MPKVRISFDYVKDEGEYTPMLTCQPLVVNEDRAKQIHYQIECMLLPGVEERIKQLEKYDLQADIEATRQRRD